MQEVWDGAHRSYLRIGLLLWLACTIQVVAQPITLSINEIKTSTLPLVRMQVLLRVQENLDEGKFKKTKNDQVF